MGEHSSELLAKERAEEEKKALEAFAACDWSDRNSIVKLFPACFQVQYEMARDKKKLTNVVDIDCYTMKTPFADQTLLKDTPLSLQPHARQCLYGANSTGKTLLFEYMSQGKIKDFPKHLHVHHCKELETHELDDTVIGTVINSHTFINILRKCNKKLDELVAAMPEEAKGEEKNEKIKENSEFIKKHLFDLKGSVEEATDRASKMLRVLGFDEIGQAKPVTALSGGLRMRVALAMAFFIEADLLLLDEPTNHLDFPSVLWLENRLRGYRGSFLLVSHDRELLNNVTTGVVLIEDLKLIYYTCGFKEFEKRKALEDKKKADEVDKFLQKNLNADPSTMLGRQRQDKKDWSERYYARQTALAGKFTFPKPTPLSKSHLTPEEQKTLTEVPLITVKDVRFSYNPNVENPVFIFNDPISFMIHSGTRVGCLGPNGAGKSTFLKLATHKIHATSGTVTDHPNFKLAYFGQHSTAELNLDQTPMEWMNDQFPEENPGYLRSHLGKTGIVGAIAETRMQRLSFSQRSCVIFSKLTYVCPHLLILDEPTNFLDLESVDSLISACNKYPGALLLVSHNRDFLRRCAKAFLSIVPGHFELYNDLKTAERATYTFIAEMEEGGGSKGAHGALGAGGGSVHASQLQGGPVPGAPTAMPGAPGAATPGAPAATSAKATPAAVIPLVYTVNETCEALWTDNKWYKVLIQKVDGPKYKIKYIEYGNSVITTAASLRKLAAKPAAAGNAKVAPAPGAKAAAAAPKAAGKR